MTSTPHHMSRMGSSEPRGYGAVGDARKRQAEAPRVRDIIARTLADMDAVEWGRQPFADVSWRHADKGQWTDRADAILAALSDAGVSL